MIDSISRLESKSSEEGFFISLRRNRKIEVTSKDCLAGKNILHIDANGVIYPCSWIAKSKLSNIYGSKWTGDIHNNLIEISQIDKLIEHRKEMYGFCGCPAMACIYSNDEYSVDPLNELLEGTY